MGDRVYVSVCVFARPSAEAIARRGARIYGEAHIRTATGDGDVRITNSTYPCVSFARDGAP